MAAIDSMKVGSSQVAAAYVGNSLVWSADAAPAAPTNVTAFPGDTEMQLNWDDNLEADLLRYEYRINGGAPVSTGSTSGVLVTGLTNSTQYTFEVRTVDAGLQTSAWVAVTGTPFPTGFNPLTQVTALHAMWASDALWTPPADGSPVDSWRNQSGGGDPAATLTERPTYRASVTKLGNRPAVDFDGVNDALVFDIANISAPYKRLTVFALNSTTGGKNVSGTGGGAGGGFGSTTGGLWQMSTSTTLLQSAVAVDTVGHVSRCDYGSSGVLRLDETSIATGTAGTTAMALLVLGAGSTSSTRSRWASCYIAFAAIYTDATSSASLATLATDLKHYYNL